jgi:hypothetical protein
MTHTPDTWPALEIAYDADGLISLMAPSPGFDDPDVVRLHPGQLVDLAQKLGLGGHTSPAALRIIATMKRRMQTMLERICRLDELLHLCGSHEDLSSEQDYSFTTWELSTEFCSDLDDLLAGLPGYGNAASVTPALSEPIESSSSMATTAPAASVTTVNRKSKPAATQPDLLEETS